MLDSKILYPRMKKLGRSSSLDEFLVSDEGRKKYIIRHVGSRLMKVFTKTP